MQIYITILQTIDLFCYLVYIFSMHQRILYTGSKKSRLIYASVSSIDKNFKPVSHCHPNTEIIYLNDGEGYIVTGEGKTKLIKGDYAVITGGAEHREEAVFGKEMIFYAIGVNDFGILKNEPGIKVFSPQEVDGKSLSRCFKSVFEELKRDNTLWEDAVDLYTELICTLTSRYAVTERGSVEIRGTSLVESAKRFIDGRFYATIKAEEIATTLNVSYSTLIHTFKNETGKTITEYKLSKQMEEAKSLLSLTDMSISQIALHVGFGTNTYFSKIFKRETGLAPKDYRVKFRVV